MWFRRTFLAAFAPSVRSAWRGTPIAASYNLHTLTTTIHFDSPDGPCSGTFDHNTSLVSLPTPTTPPPPSSHQPKITLRLENNSLHAFGPRGKFSTLMPIPPHADLRIIYPFPVHPDLTALWSINGQLYFTNNDYRNVYSLPTQMASLTARPTLLPKAR